MDHISIPIPDGMDERQKSELTRWLRKKAAEATPQRLPCEDDAEWQAETAAHIARGMADTDAGRTRRAKDGLREIADELDIELDR